MKILLLGKNGQVGRELMRILMPLGDITSLGQTDLDLKNTQALIQILKQLKPEVIVNAAAYTAVDKAEQDQNVAWLINETAVSAMAEYAKKYQATLVHYSTDYVFDGTKQGAYTETDQTNPLNVYGASKLAGEQAILASGCSNLILRTSWVYSAQGHNFIKTIFNLAQEKESLTVVEDQLGTPTSAELIADVTAHALSAHRQERMATGTYHLTANGLTNWYELACYILNKAHKQGINLKLKATQVAPIPSAAYSVPATRPKNSQLDITKLSNALQIKLPDWSHYVDRMINQLIQMRFFA